jgi:hypothetical protein
MSHMDHKYSVEWLYHIRCAFCTGWWTIGDWRFPGGSLTCPHCGLEAKTELDEKSPHTGKEVEPKEPKKKRK